MHFTHLTKYLKSIEARWKTKVGNRFDRENASLAKDGNSKKIRYILSMFPYPSGNLHLGHVRCYTSGDILTRFSKLMGNDVINPMGFDSFGLPAENAAKERGLDPSIWTNSNIRTMKSQLDNLGLKFNWREATSNPTFYKWTQYMFLKLYEANLVYSSYAKVNWDPVDRTVLADEQVDETGRSWRSGAIVEKRNLRQWFVKVSAFTNALYEAQDIDPDLWGDILSIQRNWIGQPNGWMFYLPHANQEILLVYSTNPEVFLDPKAKLIITRDHWLETIHGISKLGYIHNPFTNDKLPIRFAEPQDILPRNCQATIMGSSDNNEFHHIKREQVLLQAKLNQIGAHFTSDTYRDWLVSRQRFWGTPIPMIKNTDDNYTPVNYDELPVKLPKTNNISTMSDYESKDKYETLSPIERYAPREWKEVRDSHNNITGHRVCETLDTLFDSSWYFLRYVSEPTLGKPFNSDLVQPVWCYIGGKEHAYMHLFYARFMTHFLHSIGMINFREPFKKLLVQGYVKSRTYKLKGKYISQEEACKIDDQNQLDISFEKMSKSKGNGIDPNEILEQYGIDATRFCLMSYANPRSERLWRSSEEEFREVLIFFRRVILTVNEFVNHTSQQLEQQQGESRSKKVTNLNDDKLKSIREELITAKNRTSHQSIVYIQETNEFRQYISSMHLLLNTLRKYINTSAVTSYEFANSLASFLVFLNPVAPHLTEELWSIFKQNQNNPMRKSEQQEFSLDLYLSDQKWPLPDPDYCSKVNKNKQILFERAMS